MTVAPPPALLAQHVAKKFAMRLCHWCVWKHLKKWKLLALHARERRYALVAVFVKMQSYWQQRAFRSWRAQHDAKKHGEKVEAKVLKTMANLKQAKAFRSMRAHAVRRPPPAPDAARATQSHSRFFSAAACVERTVAWAAGRDAGLWCLLRPPRRRTRRRSSGSRSRR